MTQDQIDPTEALAMARQARARIAARADIPGWYAPLYGLLCGGIVAGGGLGQPAGIVMVGVCIALLGALYRIWSDKAGISVSGYHPGRTRTIAIGLAVLLVILMLAGLALRREAELAWAPFAAGAIAAVIAWLGSMAWDRAWKAQTGAPR
jgi:hypothetical protein